MCRKLFIGIFTLVLLSLSVHESFSQLDLSNDRPLCDTCSHNLLFEFSSANFIKNNEYPSAFVQGSTGIGYFIKPGFSYFPNSRTRIFTGVFLQQYSGLNEFSNVTPIFNVRYRPTNSITINFGSIKGSINHRLEEPIFRFDRFYQNQLEYGIQFIYKSKLLYSDSWLNWEQFIFKEDEIQEQFQVGSVNELCLFDGKIGLKIPFHFLFDHKGGEIDNSPEGVSSILNATTGLRLSFEIDEGSKINIEPLFIIYNAFQIPETGINAQAFNSGSAFYLKMAYETHNYYGMLGYWNARKFIATKGEYLFHSVSEDSKSIIDEERHLLTAKWQWKKEISESMQWQVRLDGYYDLDSKKINHAIGVYLLLDMSFVITNIKPK